MHDTRMIMIKLAYKATQKALDVMVRSWIRGIWHLYPKWTTSAST